MTPYAVLFAYTDTDPVDVWVKHLELHLKRGMKALWRIPKGWKRVRSPAVYVNVSKTVH